MTLTEQPTCMGCAVNASFPLPEAPLTFNGVTGITSILGYNGLTSEEREVLGHLAAAWEIFIKMGAKHPDHNNEFRDAIHRAQYIIGVRVAQRANPEVWYVPVENV